MTLDTVELADECCSMGGGGAFLRGGTATVRTSRVTGNAVNEFQGGRFSLDSASVSFTNVLIADNVGSSGGPRQLVRVVGPGPA